MFVNAEKKVYLEKLHSIKALLSLKMHLCLSKVILNLKTIFLLFGYNLNVILDFIEFSRNVVYIMLTPSLFSMDIVP